MIAIVVGNLIVVNVCSMKIPIGVAATLNQYKQSIVRIS